MTTDTMAPFDYQTTATYTCDVGFGLLGGDLLRICVGSSSGPGEWSGTAPTCEGIRLVWPRPPILRIWSGELAMNSSCRHPKFSWGVKLWNAK